MPEETDYIWYTISLDGKNIYGHGGVRLPIKVSEAKIKQAVENFFKLREQFQPALEEAQAEDVSWPWNDAIVTRLSADEIKKLMTLSEARQVPFPIQKQFAGVDTTGKSLGEVEELDPGLVQWLAVDLVRNPKDYDQQPAPKKLAIVAAHLILGESTRRKLEIKLREEIGQREAGPAQTIGS